MEDQHGSAAKMDTFSPIFINWMTWPHGQGTSQDLWFPAPGAHLLARGGSGRGANRER